MDTLWTNQSSLPLIMMRLEGAKCQLFSCFRTEWQLLSPLRQRFDSI